MALPWVPRAFQSAFTVHTSEPLANSVGAIIIPGAAPGPPAFLARRHVPSTYPLTPVSGTNNSQYCLHRYYVAQYAQGTVGMGVPHVRVEKKWFVIAFFQPQATSEVMILTGP